MRHLERRSLSVLVALLASPIARGETLAVVGGRVITQGPQGTLEGGTVLIRDGKIAAVGKELEVPPDAKRVDARGRIVVPGLIDAHSHLGLLEINLDPSTVDLNESSDPVTPQVRAIDGFHLSSKAISVTRQGGVTSVLVAPGRSNVVAGQCAVVKTSGRALQQILVRAPAGMQVNLGEAPKKTWAARNKSPVTRMGTAALLRAALVDAQNYLAKWRAYEEKRLAYERDQHKRRRPGEKPAEAPEEPERDLKAESLRPVLAGEISLMVHANRESDIQTALRIASEFGLKAVLMGAAEAHRLAPLLSSAGVPVIVSPVRQEPGPMEAQGARLDNAALLAQAGVLVALGTEEVHNVRNLPFEAGFAAAFGLGAERALRAITLDAARVLGVEQRLGSIEVGKDGDLVVFAGEPLSVFGKPRAVIIDGVVFE